LIKETIHQDYNNNCKYIWSECHCTQFYKTNTTRHKSTDRTQHNNSG
jgi:hypothetical protein